MKSLAVLVALLSLTFPAFAAPPKIVNAADGIIAAFHDHPLVALGEWHGLAQELDYYAVLVRDPRFAKEVHNIILEMGDASQQAVVDRYVNGEQVPYHELRKVWSDTVGAYPTVQYLGTINLYAVIRAVNLKLPPESRIKVWLGDPPIDWPQIQTQAEFQSLMDQRNSYPVALIEREILNKNKKSLVIYGTAHFGVYSGGIFPGDPPQHRVANIRYLLDSRHPGAVYYVHPYVGYTTPDCADGFEKHLGAISAPALIYPIRGTSLDDDVKRPGCTPLAKPAEVTQERWNAFIPSFNGEASDAFLYLGPRKSLTASPSVPDLYLDLEFRNEIDRRSKVRTGNGLNAIPDPSYNPATSQAFFAN
jgi:hypothetical protein